MHAHSDQFTSFLHGIRLCLSTRLLPSLPSHHSASFHLEVRLNNAHKHNNAN